MRGIPVDLAHDSWRDETHGCVLGATMSLMESNPDLVLDIAANIAILPLQELDSEW